MNILCIFTGVNTSYPGVRTRQNGRHQTRPDQIRPMCVFETVVNVFKFRHSTDTGLDNFNPQEGYIIFKRYPSKSHVCIHIPKRGDCINLKADIYKQKVTLNERFNDKVECIK
jgi:hypothetical protein